MTLDMISTTLPATEAHPAGGRLVLRPVRKSDAGLFAMYAGDRRVAEGTRGIPHPLPPGAAEAFVNRSTAEARSEDVWVMDGSASGLSEVLGVISLKRMDRDQSEIAYWVAPAFWNAGFASEAVRALIEANPQARAPSSPRSSRTTRNRRGCSPTAASNISGTPRPSRWRATPACRPGPICAGSDPRVAGAKRRAEA